MEAADKDSSNEVVTISSNENTQRDDHPLSHKEDVKLLLFTHNRMPIIPYPVETENLEDTGTRLKCISPKHRLVLLVGMTILSLMSAISFLLGVRFAYPNPREHVPKALETRPILWCNESSTDPLDNFFRYPVSLLIWCNESLGICLAIITATLMSTAIYLRHPVLHKTKENGVSRNNVLGINLVLLFIGLFACINLILLACYDLTVKPQHLIFVLSCFGSFIVYELGHNCCLMNDILRNRELTWRHQSKDSFRQKYVIFTSLAFIFGVASCLFTISGSILRLLYGQCGVQFQWMAIISTSGFFIPVYLLIVIRDYLLYEQH